MYTNLLFRNWNDLLKELAHQIGHIILRVAEKGSDILKSKSIHDIRIGFPDHQKEIFFEFIDGSYDV